MYKTPIHELTKNHLDEFNQILSKIEFSNDCLVRLIGDELADRGSNDYFTLKILEKLNEHKVPVEIIVSNHSIEFIEAYEKQDNFHAPMLSQGGHAPSMEKLQTLVEKGLVSREEILAIAEKSYKPNLRAISYSLSEDKKEITIYSHAGIGLNTIRSLAEKLKVEYKDQTASELAQTIDSINIEFQKHVKSNTVNTLYSREKMYVGYYGYSEISDAPLEFIMWNRFYHSLERPASYSGYKINFVHGHDSHDPTRENIYNLDNALGKMAYLNQGEYTVLYSPGSGLAPVNNPIAGEVDVLQETEEEPRVIALPPLAAIQAQKDPIPEVFEIIEGEPTVITLPVLHSYFLSQLEAIKAKEQELRERNHSLAADRAQELYDYVKIQHTELMENKLDIKIFKDNCTRAIDTARLELEKHRGWKQVLGNLALAVVGLGVLYVAAGLVHKAMTGNFLFFKTDSADKIDQLEESIKSMEGPK
ncbi:Dot/Icm T4SS effector Wip [Legionella adelaidensis]|uniref:Dot/Icm T4SS effector Wip n=1 Tax=Legionella adelaidensis TaxID=45056 RepID=UPI002D21E4AB|nr:Dot/Icm T4SS effector Wip [Legionella adelaidensis]